MARLLLLAILLAGCRQLLGFEELATGDATNDAPPGQRTVTFRHTRHNLECDSDGQPVRVQQAPSLDGVSVRVDGGTPTLSLVGDAITFNTPIGASYRILLDTAEGPVELHTSVDQPVFDDIIFARADQELASDGTNVRYTAVPVGEGYFVVSTGVWAFSKQAASNGSDVEVAWAEGTGIAGASVGLVDGERNDRLHLVKYTAEGSPTTGSQVRINRFQNDVIKLADGATTTIPGAQADTVNGQVQLVADFTTIDERAATIPGFEDPRWSYFVFSTPDRATHADRGILLAALDQGSLSLMHAHNVAFPTSTFPFPTTGYSELRRTRSAQSTAGIVTLQVRSRHFDTLADDSAILVPGFDPLVGVTTLPTLNDVALDVDELTLDLDPGVPANLAWTGQSPVDMYVVQLADVATSPPNIVKTYYTVQPSLLVDPSDLVPGNTYSVRIRAVLGFSRAAAGDFTTGSLPQDWFEVDSGTFRIAF